MEGRSSVTEKKGKKKAAAPGKAKKKAPAPAARAPEAARKPVSAAKKPPQARAPEKPPAGKEASRPPEPPRAPEPTRPSEGVRKPPAFPPTVSDVRRQISSVGPARPPEPARPPLRTQAPAAPPRPPAGIPPAPPRAPEVRRPAPPPPPRPAEARPVPPPPPPPRAEPRVVEVRAPITVKDLAALYGAKPADLISRLIRLGVFANINQSVNFETAAKLAADFGLSVRKPEAAEGAPEPEIERPARSSTAKLASRPPIVTFMGHVDHGKTSLLDAIRKTRVAAGEAGGITQHIGAYEVFLKKGAVTFLDTPGHEAFTEMRARGAKVTDIVVLVVAADDGVMPQTEEAIDHAQAADVPIVVAINKTDLPAANPDRVKKELAEHGLQPEDWGGKTITVNVSARTGKGIDQLLEMLLLEAELLELQAEPSAPADGIVIEAKLSKGSGPVATVLIQNGTLRIGDVVVCGEFMGRVRAMMNDRGERIREAPPAMPVEIAGLSGVPRAGEHFQAVESDQRARALTERRRLEREAGARSAHVTLEDLYSQIQAGKLKSLKLVLKADVQGSIEAIRSTLAQIATRDVQLNIIHTGIGNVTKSDVMLAAASDAIVIGFHVDVAPDAQDAMKLEKVEVRLYEIIYEVKTAIEKAIGGLFTPEMKEVFLGAAEIRQVFKVSKIGIVAGSMVTKGKIVRNASCRLVRNGKTVHEGKISGLKRFKDDAREVAEGFECGISISNCKEYLPGDRIEVYEIQSKEPGPS
jgi:translation initiation factor IF-2